MGWARVGSSPCQSPVTPLTFYSQIPSSPGRKNKQPSYIYISLGSAHINLNNKNWARKNDWTETLLWTAALQIN